VRLGGEREEEAGAKVQISTTSRKDPQKSHSSETSRRKGEEKPSHPKKLFCLETFERTSKEKKEGTKRATNTEHSRDLSRSSQGGEKG